MLVEIKDLNGLVAGDGCCVILDNVDDLDVVKYHYEKNVWNKFIVYARPSSYRAYVQPLVGELAEFPEEVQQILTFGKLSSERATIHNLAIELGMKVSVNYRAGNFVYEVRVAKKGERRGAVPNWWNRLKEDEAVRVKLNDEQFSTFRNRVYRVAKAKDAKIKVEIDDDCKHVLLTLTKKRKSNQAAFLAFLSTIPELNKTKVPEEFSEMTDNYIRVLLTKHVGTFSYKAGYIRRHPTNQGPHIDKHGNFIYIERNYGPRPPAFIKLKLKGDTSDAAQALVGAL
ncbi:hypothetical protein NVP1072O_43 [Vibrio phage 1.072.O._10N.286.48.A12]|nr:hypothetical protein NVP1004O_42 [Vibrio phage 1.004.O._10N.261.54.A2]AUR83602.1 hypothetical protein NVP1037O_42 [Vibrio phage 1.037.O._10N.261.52.F7]AUR84487.1 hypothetical protein NVP1056O_45 [Vibrio phage 1.056.O._10N.261.48.C11]AUR85004.1 hypothetical protein NVP1066O_45 [Vibrio phage 1.066.O._10N.286.46.E8]AUR85135.1 hypothetical protein NVP1068O_45 [Vibrio phage 1.068.O._10N.261.51.F8]AUR85360.1 hypothetical protein NVP1072O_43 [Vibrio phage 1.072.O._10N.286.48.A12]